MKLIYVFGDSLVVGQGDTEPNGWVGRLQEKIISTHKIKSFGVGGDTSRDLLKRIELELDDSHPDIIMIAIGANDTQYSSDPNNTLIDIEEFKKNISDIFDIIQGFSSRIFFVGIPKMDDSITKTWQYMFFNNENIKKFNKAISDFCQKRGVRFIDIFDCTNPEDLSDGAHPNSKGYQKITEKIYSNLDFK